MRSRWDWLAALTGVAAIVFGFLSIVVGGGDPDDAGEGAEKVVAFYQENQGEAQIGAILSVIGAMFLVFFFGYLRRVLRRAEGEGGTLSILALVGAAILATGIAIDATLLMAMAEAVDEDVDPNAILAMQAIWDNDWLPMQLGALVVLFSVGLSVVRHGALPKWLGWVAILLGLIGLTPIGFVGLLGLLAWVLVVSILLAVRAHRAPADVPVETRV